MDMFAIIYQPTGVPIALFVVLLAAVNTLLKAVISLLQGFLFSKWKL